VKPYEISLTPLAHLLFELGRDIEMSMAAVSARLLVNETEKQDGAHQGCVWRSIQEAWRFPKSTVVRASREEVLNAKANPKVYYID